MKVAYSRSGFTLIELMVVVGIIGILASTAIPQYRNYTTRARLTEALQTLATARLSVSEFYITQGRLPATFAETGLSSDALPADTSVVRSLRYHTDNRVAILTIEVQNTRSPADGRLLSLEGETTGWGLRWRCRAGGVGANRPVPLELLPANCR